MDLHAFADIAILFVILSLVVLYMHVPLSDTVTCYLKFQMLMNVSGTLTIVPTSATMTMEASIAPVHWDTDSKMTTNVKV